MNMKSVLVTGGLGYIGSHIAYDLLLYTDFNVVIIDNLSNSSLDILDEFKQFEQRISFIECDCRNKNKLTEIFKMFNIYSVIHLAGFKSVNESVDYPLTYYDNNINSTIVLLKVMKKFNCYKLIFSSSCSVYGNPKTLPITEETELNPVSPYAKTKYMQEIILKDIVKSEDNLWSIYSLRYFNPIGHLNINFKDKSQTNLMPNVIKAAQNEKNFVNIYGNDYNTPDGTAIRDYIHILDLSNAHIKALKELDNIKGYIPLNIGIGKGISVLEFINKFVEVNPQYMVSYVFKYRRAGDVASVYCSNEKAKEKLNWGPLYEIKDALKI
jgi:UDP-glucose 4-epimerase